MVGVTPLARCKKYGCKKVKHIHRKVKCAHLVPEPDNRWLGHVVRGSKEHIPNSAEKYALWLYHGTVPSSVVGPVPRSAVDKDPWLCLVATPSSAARRPVTQLSALKQKHPMALP
jgi:hypothetical protein